MKGVHKMHGGEDEDSNGLGLLINEVFTLAAYDALGDLQPHEAAALERELGANWQEQLLSPITQPMTLRSGKILQPVSGGGCPLAIRFLARVILTAFLTLTLMVILQPYVPSAVAASSQTWSAVQVYGKQGMELLQSCPVGVGQNLLTHNLCGKYYMFLQELQFHTLDTIAKLSATFSAVATGTSALTFSMARAYAFVRAIVRTGDVIVMSALDAICYPLQALVRVGYRPADATGTLSPEQKRAVEMLMIAMANEYREQSKQNGGAFYARKRRPSPKRKQT